MKVMFHPVGVVLTEEFRRQAERKLERALHVFHRMDSVHLFVKAVRPGVELEVLVRADDDRLYVVQAEPAGDLVRGLDLLVDRLAENARKHVSRRKRHTTWRTQHHNQLVFHRHVESPADRESSEEVFSSKPLSRFEAWLELRVSPAEVLVYREAASGRVEVMIKERGRFFLVAPARRLPFGPRPKPGEFERYEFTYRGERFVPSVRERFEVPELDLSEAMRELRKEDFCFFRDRRRGWYSVLFRYGRGKVGLVEGIEV